MREENSCLLWVFIFAILALASIGCEREEDCYCEVFKEHRVVHRYDGPCRAEDFDDWNYLDHRYTCIE